MRRTLITLCVSVVLAGAAAGDEGVTTERVASEWAAREQMVKTGRLVWTVVETQPKKYAHIFLGGRSKYKFDKDLILKATDTVTIDGRKLRHEHDGQMWSTDRNVLGPLATVSTFDGRQFGHSILKCVGCEHPQTTLTTVDAPEEMRTSGLLPVWYSLRGSLVAAPKLSIAGFRPTGQRVTVADRPCHEFVQDATGAGNRTQLFLDAERAFQVVRRVGWDQGKVEFQTDVTYQPDRVLGWVPRAWEFVWRATTGEMVLSQRYTMTECLLNPEVADAAFAPVTPLGAHVIELASGKEVHYGILPDGTKGREYRQNGQGFTYADLMKRPRWSVRSWELWAALGAAWAVVLGLALLYRRRARKPTVEAPPSS